MNCQYQNQCLNNDKCLVCNNMRLLKMSHDKQKHASQARYQKQIKKTDTRDDSKESWNSLEDTVAAALNTTPTHKQYYDTREARRQSRSGAIWFMPGDVIDEFMLMECKERSTVDTKGKSVITIQKEWLDKILKEADGGKYPALAFRYKNSEDIYFVQNFDILCDMVAEIKFLREELARLKGE